MTEQSIVWLESEHDQGFADFKEMIIRADLSSANAALILWIHTAIISLPNAQNLGFLSMKKWERKYDRKN